MYVPYYVSDCEFSSSYAIDYAHFVILNGYSDSEHVPMGGGGVPRRKRNPKDEIRVLDKIFAMIFCYTVTKFADKRLCPVC